MDFAKELLKMYDDVNDFDELKARYENIAKGNIPDNIPETKIEEKEINICDLLLKVGFAPSKSEAKRMVQGKGVKIDSITVSDIGENICIKDGVVVQFGKNKFIKVLNV